MDDSRPGRTGPVLTTGPLDLMLTTGSRHLITD